MGRCTAALLTVVLILLWISAVSAGDVVFRHSDTQYIEARLSSQRTHTWHIELQSHGTLTVGDAFPEPHVSWSLWAADSGMSRIGHREPQSTPVQDIFHLAPGNYELRARAAEPSLVQLSLQFQSLRLPTADRPAFRRGEGDELLKGTLLSGYFGYRRTTAPVLPGEHYRTLTMESSHNLAATLYALDSPVPVRISLWQEQQRLDYFSAADTATLHASLDSGSYSVAVQTHRSQAPAAYVLFVIEPDRSDTLQLLDSMPEDDEQYYHRENPILLGFNRLICPDSAEGAVGLSDHRGRTVAAETRTSGGLVIVTPLLPLPGDSLFRVWVKPDLRCRDGTPLGDEVELEFRTAVRP